MARRSGMKGPLYIVDTGYLLEEYRIPGHFNDTAHGKINRRFADAIQTHLRLYVPFPVLFELANHIAGIQNGDVRRKQAKKLAKAVETSIVDASPWIITPLKDRNILLAFEKYLQDISHGFATEFAIQGIGWVDISVISEAKRLKAKSNNLHTIHIWTTDDQVKSREPDPEPNPYLGERK
ncbi:MAG: hypothetical protein HQL52_00570 [Magnetococcales bacterium]|nr:hypothetical protein [Magnetococcales bacterium]